MLTFAVVAVLSSMFEILVKRVDEVIDKYENSDQEVVAAIKNDP
ncbi:MAG: hypothetical protein ABF545_06405 [Bifidobacterium psychraerophilum]